MAVLTEEQKIIIGVTVGVAGLVLLAIFVFICCTFYGRQRKIHHRYYKNNLVDTKEHNGYMNGRPFTINDHKVPSSFEPPFIPQTAHTPLQYQPHSMLSHVYYKKPRSIERAVMRQDSWDRRATPPPNVENRHYSGNRWNDAYRNEPIVVHLAEPKYLVNDIVPKDQDVIYLKYLDDQALLPRTNHYRKSGYGKIRRARSITDLRRTAPYVGEWDRRPDNFDFNERAMKAGRDPFLWKG